MSSRLVRESLGGWKDRSRSGACVAMLYHRVADMTVPWINGSVRKRKPLGLAPWFPAGRHVLG